MHARMCVVPPSRVADASATCLVPPSNMFGTSVHPWVQSEQALLTNMAARQVAQGKGMADKLHESSSSSIHSGRLRCPQLSRPVEDYQMLDTLSAGVMKALETYNMLQSLNGDL